MVYEIRTYRFTVPVPLIRSDVAPVTAVKLPSVVHVELLVEC